MSDLAERLRERGQDWSDSKRDLAYAAADELDRLADELAEVKKIERRLRADLDRAQVDRDKYADLYAQWARRARELSSAGPPQEADEHIPARYPVLPGDPAYVKPAPGRRCTTAAAFHPAFWKCIDPACPVHGTVRST